ncbi:MAG: SpoIIE family protein phosphatase, partial [Clostridiaceae bacterium]|nr:SpoIIE family protein phosphatase [Clostridiaceae bacterium]
MGKQKVHFSNIKPFIQIGLAGACFYSVFGLVYLLYDKFHEVMSIANYLTWHNAFEFTSVLVSLSVFLVSYYSYEQTGNLRSAFMGSVFFTMGMIDAFHTLSFKGMPAFFIENDTANRATTFWITARYIGAIGFLTASFIKQEKKSQVKKGVFVVIPLIISISALVLFTYFPSVLPPMYAEETGLTAWKVYSEFIIIAVLIIAAARFIFEYNKTKERHTFLFSISLILKIFSEAAFVLYSSIYDIYNYLGHIYKFLAFFIIFRVIFISNIKKPYSELKEAEQKLRSYADNLDILVMERTLELKKLNDMLLEDLEYARDIQKAVFSSKLPEYEEVAFEVKYYPAERVSGDFYNIFKIDSDNIAFYIGDVSGHGVPAAMLTVYLNQTVKILMDNEMKNMLSPADVLNSLYVAFNSTNFKENVYIVMLYAVYNLKERKIVYSSAGLNVQPILIKSSGELSDIKLNGFPICKFIEYYSEKYENSYLILEKNDKILFHTDGLVEAQNRSKGFYSDNRLKALISA